MKPATDLQKTIEQVKNKLAAEHIDIDDYDKAIECLEQTVNPRYCIEIYENYINY